jgi:hypothetical protein
MYAPNPPDAYTILEPNELYSPDIPEEEIALGPPAPTTTEYAVPGITVADVLYAKAPPPPPLLLPAPPPPPTATTLILVTPIGANQV